ncbi:RNA helicase [Orbilia oligospora]|uniref:ATP-dependent RNA helicase n=2 Tax=Orbilia oligospora TaxID=2813651 RepID=A0A6G1M224_ORBOL|nr:RNA helicase [Orbilia oligospora]KAF3240082.1 RNA helicase [Orbilia oligospora]
MSSLIQRSRPSNLLVPQTAANSVCISCLARLRQQLHSHSHSHSQSQSQLQLPGNHATAAPFHSSAVNPLPRGEWNPSPSSSSRSNSHSRNAVGGGRGSGGSGSGGYGGNTSGGRSKPQFQGHRALKSIVHKPSRMTLSEKVARTPRSTSASFAQGGRRSKSLDKRQEPTVDTGGGMNRRVFKLRSEDKSQYSRETERRKRDLRETTLRPSPSRFQQRPALELKSERRSSASKLDTDNSTTSTEKAERRLAAAKLDGEGGTEKKYTRPPIRRFGQMKHIASLDHVSSRTREITHAAEEQFNTFETFDLLPQTLEALYKDALDGLEGVTPTPVQSLVIPTLLDKSPAPPLKPLPSENSRHKKSKDPLDLEQFDRDESSRQSFKTYLIAAETGSGKTLSYVLPLMDTLKRRELHQKSITEAEESQQSEILEQKGKWMFDIPAPPVTQDTTVGKPFAVILVPTSELVFQVGSLLKKLSFIIKLRTEMISKDFSGAVIRSRLFKSSTPDIIVGTPFMIDRITEANPSMLHRTSHIIVDEADSLFDRSFSTLTGPIISRALNLEKLVLCSATIPKSLDTYITKKYPDCKRLVTANLHAVPRRIQLQVVDVMNNIYKGSKLRACAHLCQTIVGDSTEPGFAKRVVVFVNERETTDEVTKFLQETGFNAVSINRDSDSRKILESFTGEREASTADWDGVRKGGMKILVTTDLASRGVDTKNVKNIILYDVPYTSIDFIHRLGRTGRMGRRGRAWILVDKDSNQEYVKEVRKTMFLGQALI